MVDYSKSLKTFCAQSIRDCPRFADMPLRCNKIRGQPYKAVDSIARNTESDAGGCCASNIQNLRYISDDPIFAMEMK